MNITPSNYFPFLSYINYEGVGIVVCYYTIRDGNPAQIIPPHPVNPYPVVLRVVFGLAKDLISGTSGWNQSSINEIYNYITPVGRPAGYQSFFHPINQYKGIGVCFDETNHNNDSYPEIFFTNDDLTNGSIQQHINFINIVKKLGL